jgi:hypothetical protein
MGKVLGGFLDRAQKLICAHCGTSDLGYIAPVVGVKYTRWRKSTPNNGERLRYEIF